MLTQQHHADLLALALAAGFSDLDLTSHPHLSGYYTYTAMLHNRYADCRMLATNLPAYATLEEFLAAVRQELLALRPGLWFVVATHEASVALAA